MNDELAIIEKQYADFIAAEYLGQGCQVLRDVPLEFLPGYRADMVVKNGAETRVVEVRTRPSLSANPGLREFERIVNSRPGWKFELQLVGEPERLDAEGSVRSLEVDGILSRLAQAETALDTGLPEAAFLLAWSAADAVVRTSVAAEGVVIKRVTPSGYVLDYAVYLGAIDRDDYNYLRSMAEYCNAIAHGFETSGFTGTLAIELIAKVKALLSEYSRWTASSGMAEISKVIE